MKRIVDALEDRGTSNVPVADSDELKKLNGILEDFGQLVEKAPANVPLKRI